MGRDRAVTALLDASRTLAHLPVDAAVFAADAPGRAGQVGRALYQQLTAALAARAEEAAEAARRVDATEAAVHTAIGRYADVDDAAGRRLRDRA